MGRGFWVFEQPAHATPCLTPQEATLYVHNDLQLFTSQYPGRDWVNNALIDEGDKGLHAEALCYRRMLDEMTDKEAELNVIQDRITVLMLDLRAAMQHLSHAKAVTRIKDQRTTALPSTPFLHGWWSKGVPPEEGVMSRPLPWWVLHGRGYGHIRIRLLPIVVPGDCLASVLYAFLY